MKAVSDAVGFGHIEHASLTDVGIRRDHNQDAFGVFVAPTPEAWRERGHIFLVADGMGAHAVGELASAIAADLIPHTYHKHANLGPGEALRKAFEEANATIHQRGLQNPEFHGMGTTSTALLLRPEGAWVAHVGDSRLYRLRGNQIEQLSFDHSLQWELARRQQVSPDSIAGIPSNVIVRSLGPENNVQVDIEGPHPVYPGDAFLVCSDGLSNQLSDQELGTVLKYLPLTEACQFLVDLANLRGGPDNITIVAVRIPGSPPAATAAPASARSPWHGLVNLFPWPTILLFLGSILAIVALFIAVNQKPITWGIALFAVSAAMILGGIVGMFFHRRHEAAAQAREELSDSLQVYRRGNAQLDASLIEKFMQIEANLMEIIKEKGWTIEETRLQNLRKTVAEQMKKQDLVAAFRTQCQALKLLNEKLRLHRNKDEQFKPNW